MEFAELIERARFLSPGSVCQSLLNFRFNLKIVYILLFFCFVLFYVSDKTDEDDSASATYQAVSELPQANRDTLAYLVVHLQK